MEKMKNVPEIRFEGFSEDWNIDTFENLTSINQGLQISIVNRYLKRIPNSHFYITNEFLKEGSKSEYYILNPPESVLCTKDDVLMTRTGNTGEVVTDVNGAFHNNFFKIDFDRKVIDKDYLVHFLKNDSTKALILNLAGVSTIPDLNHNDFYQITMPFPDIDEQIKISAVLNNLDNSIKNHNTQLKKLTNLKKAMLVKMFPQDGASIPEIRFKGFDGEWERVKLDDIGFSKSGTSIESEFNSKGRYKVISIGSYSENSTYTDQGLRVNLNKNTEKRILKKNDLTMVLNDKTMSGNILGRVLLIEESDAFVYNQRTQRIEPNQNKFNAEFLYQLFNAPTKREKIIKICQGNTQIYVNWSIVKELKYLIPQINEQQKIGNYFKNLDDLISNHKEQLKKLNQIKKACLSKLFVSQD